MQQWPLTYNWQGRLKRNHLAPLRATITTSKGPEIQQSIKAFISRFDEDYEDEMVIAGERTKVWYHGGVIITPMEALLSKKELVVTLLSHGEDCFDSLKSFADELCDIVRGVDAQATIRWSEKPYVMSGMS